jgi:hypothetical protein
MEFPFDPIPESMELIPGAELIPQCATSRNRMYSLGINANNYLNKTIAQENFKILKKSSISS